MIDGPFIEKLSQEINGKLFFLERITIFEEDLDDRVIFLYPVNENCKPDGKSGKEWHYYLGVLENFKLCLLEIQENKDEEIDLQTPVFRIDIRCFISEDILKVKITDFLGLKIEFYGDDNIPHINLDVMYYTLETLETEKDIGRDYLCKTISFPLAQLFERKALFEEELKQAKNQSFAPAQKAAGTFPAVNRYDSQGGVHYTNTGTLNENYKSIGIQNDELGSMLVLKSWNPHKKTKIMRIPGDTGSAQIIAVHSDEHDIFVSCENESIYRLTYDKEEHKKFELGNNLFAISLLKIGNYLFAAMTNRAIYRIHLETGEIDSHILDSAPIFLVPLGTDKIIVTTKQKQLFVFRVNNKIEAGKLAIYESIRKNWDKNRQTGIREACKEILAGEFSKESQLAALEFAAYSWVGFNPGDVYTPLKALIYMINRNFRRKSDKGGIILDFVYHYKDLIFSGYAQYSLLLKEFYITSSDKYRIDFLKLLHTHANEIKKEIKNEVDFLCWNSSEKDRREPEILLNLFGLLWFYKDGFYIEYVKAIPLVENGKIPGAENGVISYFRIADTGTKLQRIAVVESKKGDLFFLDRQFFEDGILPGSTHLALDKKSKIRKILFTGEKDYFFYTDETQELKIFSLSSRKQADSLIPGKIALKDLLWNMETIPVRHDGNAFELLVMGFKNSGLKVYLFNYEQPGTLKLLYENKLQDDWVRDLDIIAAPGDSFCYEIAAVGSRRKKLYRFVLQLVYDEKSDTFEVNEKELQVKYKKTTRSLYCVKFFPDDKGSRYIVMGSDQGDLYFLDDGLNLKWQQKLEDSIRTIKICPGKDGKRKEIVVGVGSGDIFFFSQYGFIRREIGFGKPLHSIDAALLNLEKGNAHIIACIDNRLVVYEINREYLSEKIKDFTVPKGITGDENQHSRLCAFDSETARFCEIMAESGIDPKSPVLTQAESLIYYSYCRSAESVIDRFKKDSGAFLTDYCEKDRKLFLQSLGHIIDNTDRNNYQLIDKIISFINERLGNNDEEIQWNILKFYQKVYQHYKKEEKAGFLDELDRLLKDKDTKKIKPVYAQSYWLLDSVAIAIANVLNIEESNILVIINDLLAKNMPHQVYDGLAHYFNHKPAFEYLFSLYCELDKTPINQMKEEFANFACQLEQKEDVITATGIKHLNKLNRLYQQALKSLQIDTIVEIQRKDNDIDITQPLYELETVGFNMRTAFKEMCQNLQNIEVKAIEQEKYFTKKIESIREVQNQLKKHLMPSKTSAQVGNKLILLIALHWDEILDKTINEYQDTIKIQLKSEDENRDSVLLNSSSLILENTGGAAAGGVEIQAFTGSLQPKPEPYAVGQVNPGPESEVQVPISELLENPDRATGKFDIKLEVGYKDAGNNPRKTMLGFRLHVMSSDKHANEIKWKRYREDNPNLFDYPGYYPANYQKVAQEILRMIRKGEGLLFLQGEEGVGRSSLLIYLSLFLKADIPFDSFYLSIDTNIRGIRRKDSRFKAILHRVLETVDKTNARKHNEIEHYMERLKKFFDDANGVNILFINNLEDMRPDFFVDFYPLLERISEYAVIVAAVDRNMSRLLGSIGKEEKALNISIIPDPDQENLFNRELGDDFRDALPPNWRLLVGNQVYSTYLLSRLLKAEPGKMDLYECAERIWIYYDLEKDKGKNDYYRNVWNTLSLNEKLIVYVCAKEHTEIAVEDLKAGLYVGGDPFLRKKNYPDYKILVKPKEKGEVRGDYYLKENLILEEDSVDYLHRAKDRIILKDIKKGYFPVKIHNEETLLHKSYSSRRILANYLQGKGSLDKKLKELSSLGILRDVRIGGEVYYCHSDYIFMNYLIRTFESYDRLVEKRDLITGYSLKEILYAVNTFEKDDRNRFVKFLSLDEPRTELLGKLNNHWQQFKLEKSITQDFYDFLKQIFYLETVKDYSEIQLFDHFCEGFFRFKIQVVNKFTHLILIIIPDEKTDLTQLDLRLEGAADFYQLSKGTELIFMITTFDRLQLKHDIDKYNLNIVLLDENSLKRYIQAEKRELELLHQVAHYLDLRTLSPYRYTKGVAGDMFVGRKKELDKIINNPDTDFAIFGERKIGKTSLLKQIAYRCKETIKHVSIFPVFIDLFQVSTPYDFIEKLNNCMRYEGLLGQPVKKRIENMRDFESVLVQYLNNDTRTRLIFLFDEIDDLYSTSFVECRNCSAKQMVTKENYERIKDGFSCSFCDVKTVPRDLKPRQEIETVHDIFASFRSISQTYQRCQFVFTGFKILYHLHRHHGSEFVNFTQPLDLGRLDYDDIKSLVVEPMKRLNIDFQSEDEILEKLNDYSLQGIPWIIQFYCDRIIEKLADDPEPEVKQQLIDEIALEIQPDIDLTIKYTIKTSRERGLLKLILLYREKMGARLGEEFRVEDLLELQNMLDIGPDQRFRKVEVEYYLDLFRRCFFLKRENKVKEGHTDPQHYFSLNIHSDRFESI